jgi:hypothetical protein
MNLLQTGSASTEYYLSGWRRIDDVSAQTATISKPQQRQTIFLDLAKRTYQVSGPEYRFANETPPPYEKMRNPNQQMNGPGTGKLVINVSVTPLGSMTIENVPTTGYRSSFNMTETQSTGSCVDGSFQVSWTEYLSPYAEPTVPSGGGVAYRRTSTTHPELFALMPGCRPTIVTHASGGNVPGGRLAMWSLVTIGAGAPSAYGPVSGGFSTLIERGNVRTLTAADKGLFGIPPGFTQQAPSS